jgi:cellulose synthase operon protein C
VRSEVPTVRGSIKADEFDKQLSHGEGKEDARAAIASFLGLASQDPIPVWLTSRLPVVQAYLEKNEASLPVRAVWLAGYRLSQLAGADVLGLARVRDRLLQRLLAQGLQAETDLPSFLRYHGHKDSERMRTVREKAMELHGAVREWTKHIPVNLPFVDLLFAFALAKLQETTLAKRLVEDARKVMEVPIPTSWTDNKHFEAVVSAVTSNFLFKAFKSRVDQVLAGKPHAGQMAPELMAELEEMGNKGKVGGTNNPFLRADYVIGRMREQSRIIEPQERLDPYSYWTKNQDALKKELADLHNIKEPGKLADRIRKLHKDGVHGKSTKEVQFLVLHEALPLSPRVGESFTVELLNYVPSALIAGPANGAAESPDTPKKQSELLERALFLAGHFGRTDLVKKLVDEFSDLIHSKPEDARFKLINVVAGQCLRSLKKLDMRDDIDRFLTKLHQEVLRGQTTEQLKKKHSSKPEMWSAVLQTLLNLAGGWLTYGWSDRAEPILAEARHELLASSGVKLQPKEYTELARAYVGALGHGASESGLARITELFRKMDDKKITNTWTTSPFYSRFHLNIVEDVIRAIVSDDFALGPGGRKWLDDDEYLVRKRIHADMRRHLEKSGL